MEVGWKREDMKQERWTGKVSEVVLEVGQRHHLEKRPEKIDQSERKSGWKWKEA